MATTAEKFPSTASSVVRGGATAWTSPGNATANDAADATVVVPADYLVTSSYSFNIPLLATILGVTVNVEASETGTGSSNYIPQLNSNTTPTLIGSSKTAVTVNGTTKVVSTSGGVADLWSATLTPAIVNASGFGVTIWSTDTTNTLAVDYISMQVTYGEWSEAATRQEKVFRRHGWRKLQVPLEVDSYPSPPPPFQASSLWREKAFRRHGWRHHKKAIDPGAFNAHALYSNRPVERSFITNTIRSRRFQTAPDVPGDRRLAPPFVAYAPNKGTKRLRTTHHRIPGSVGLEWLTTTPSVGVTSIAAVERPKTHRRGKLLRDIRETGVFTGTRTEPPSYADPSAYKWPKVHRRHDRRPDVELVEIIVSNQVQPKQAWTPGPSFRRFGYRHFLSVRHVWKMYARPVGIATETDTASALDFSRSFTVGLATETDSSLALGTRKLRAASVASETDTAFAESKAKLRLVAVALESDLAGALLAHKQRSVGVALETDSDFALGRVKQLAFIYCEETDRAFALTLFPRPGIAEEVEEAFALNELKIITAGLATETETASALRSVHNKNTGYAVEVSTTSALGKLKARLAQYGQETDTALALVPVRVYEINLAHSQETAFALTPQSLSPWDEGSVIVGTWTEDTTDTNVWTEQTNASDTWT